MSIMVPFVFVKQKIVAITNHISPIKDFVVPQRYVIRLILFVLYIQPLSNLIKRHSLSVHSFADDIQIETSILSQHVHGAISSVEICIFDIKN